MATPVPIENIVAMDPDAVISQGRLDLAVALRWAARLGLSEGVDNHFSMAVPGED